MKFRIIFTLLILTALSLSAQSKKVKEAVVKKLSHQEVFTSKMKMAKQATMAKSVVEFGMSFLNSVYPKSHIDTSRRSDGTVKLQPISQEVLVVNLRLFDCVTFVESMISLSQTHRVANPTFDVFKEKLKHLRYRNGRIDYAARLHYFSDWLFENEKQGIIKQITKDLEGEIYPKKVFYMSYKKDTMYGNMADPLTYETIKNVENDITTREKIYIPKNKVAAMQHLLKDGDIIGITNKTDGMDMAHAGIIVRVDGQAHLMHASSQYRKVIITEGPLSDYLLKNKMQTGIMVARLVD
jgi:hypothetical protein